MSYYNTTGLFSSKTPIDLIIYANSQVGETLFSGLMVAVFIILLFALKRYEFSTSFVASSFVCMILSSIGAATGMLKLFFPIAFLMMFAFSGLYLFMNKG